MNDTKLVRVASYMGHLIDIGSASGTPVKGVGIKYLTVCGGSDITPLWAPAPVSPVNCPRMPTDCGTLTKDATLHPEGEAFRAPKCVDVSVLHSASESPGANGKYPSPPVSFAVEFDHVDLEDATGHALSLRGAPNVRVNDIYFHDGAINYSGVTAILTGVDGVERCQFIENRTGVTGGIARWISFRNNNGFTRNYIWPQGQGGQIPGNDPPGDPNESGGGTLEFDVCADQIEVLDNTFIGPGTEHWFTTPLELYGRNITVVRNVISGYAYAGIAAHSLDTATFEGNTITFSGTPTFDDGGITVTTVGAAGPCRESNPPSPADELDVYRESKDIRIIGNNQISGQSFGVNLAEHEWKSTGVINGLTIEGNTVTVRENGIQYRQAPFVLPRPYVGASTTLDIRPSPNETPRLLPVNVVSSALCSPNGVAKAQFTFSASDDSDGSANLPGLEPRIDYGAPGYAGASQIRSIHGVFSSAGPPSGPSFGSEDCQFIYRPLANEIALIKHDGTWLPATLGLGGTITIPNVCTIDVGSSSVSAVQPGQYALSLTLDVTFLGAAEKRHVYAYTSNKNGINSSAPDDGYSSGYWRYWGFWKKP